NGANNGTNINAVTPALAYRSAPNESVNADKPLTVTQNDQSQIAPAATGEPQNTQTQVAQAPSIETQNGQSQQIAPAPTAPAQTDQTSIALSNEPANHVASTNQPSVSPQAPGGPYHGDLAQTILVTRDVDRARAQVTEYFANNNIPYEFSSAARYNGR